MKQLIRMVIVLGLTWLGGCSLHQAKPMVGIVQDAVTHEPIDNALVVIEWRLTSGLWTTTEAGVLTILETRTDEQGNFRIPGWGPRITFYNAASNSPKVTVFKQGYWPNDFPNDRFGKGYRFSLDSDWSGQTLLLKAYTGDDTLEDEVRSMESLAKVFTFRMMMGVGCFWEKVPLTTAEVLKAKLRYEAKKIPNSLPSLEYIATACSDPMEVLKEYLQ